ncbi:DEAD/DEAH box helicase [Bartonella sp. TP]|uniref:DEAD/DEAH box helicase n=1 Tax=Bartonella sp. TP TaxID=3057550 RepID=UPI0025AEF9E9|nr:DEAD/DEAH box helicase [Bartonella sp. TP]MDN5248734.1 DEAD/DEAH box helicase [Alphaproteobacteria bacterium]WJW80545.1 DEAD/DEAH box helicase [Bartonella sp. TP]
MMSFADMGLTEKIVAAIAEAGYTAPTEIQQLAIPQILNRKDIIGLSQTGTGKTASFVLPMLSLLEKGRSRARMPRALVLAPTRELAAQVADDFNKYKTISKLNIALLIGGVSFENQSKKLETGADILIATPGRLLDHFNRGKILLTAIEILVIDEADRMLDMGFIPDIESILKFLPKRKQTLLFSATMDPQIESLAHNYLRDPIHIQIAGLSSSAQTIKQYLIHVEPNKSAKRQALQKLLEQEKTTLVNAIVFCNRKTDSSDIYKWLVEEGYQAGALHGDIRQKQRMHILEEFKAGNIQILVATDIAARGLDIAEIGHVFNFDIPNNKEDYIHRIGRTGRAGRLGKAFTLVTPKETKQIEAIQEMSGDQIPWLSLTPAKKIVHHPATRHKVHNQEKSVAGFGEHIPAFMLIKTS